MQISMGAPPLVMSRSPDAIDIAQAEFEVGFLPIASARVRDARD